MHSDGSVFEDERRNLQAVWKAIQEGNRHIMDIYEASGLRPFWPMAHTCLLLLMEQGYITLNDGYDRADLTRKGREATALPDFSLKPS
jgi:hypothetical protein